MTRMCDLTDKEDLMRTILSQANSRLREEATKL